MNSGVNLSMPAGTAVCAGEDPTGRGYFASFRKAQRMSLHQHADSFQAQEPSVLRSYGKLSFDADRFQSAHATYAQDHLLLHAQVGIAVIERVGDVFVLLVVLRDIRVK